MDSQTRITISREQLFTPEIEQSLMQQRTMLTYADAAPAEPGILRRVAHSGLFYLPLSGLLGGIVSALCLEPWMSDFDQTRTSDFSLVGTIYFAFTGALVIGALVVGEGGSCRRWGEAFRQAGTRAGIAFVLGLGAMFPIGFMVLLLEALARGSPGFTDIRELPPTGFVIVVVFRSTGWAIAGSFVALALSVGGKRTAQLTNAVLGGAAGGALGGLFFDPIDRFLTNSYTAGVSRLVGLAAIGVSIGIFVALGENLSRVGWLRVRTGPLMGKSFILHHAVTTIGSALDADIYLFKDPDVAGQHAIIKRIGVDYVVEETDLSAPVEVNQVRAAHRQLSSGDQITIGATVLDFEERKKVNPQIARDKADL